jgi:hypothetical protein
VTTSTTSALRYSAAVAILAATALFIDAPPPVQAEEQGSVEVSVLVEGECENEAAVLSFLPSIFQEVGTVIVGDLVGSTGSIDLDIMEGLDALCNTTFGAVQFTQNGFTDPKLTSTFFCDGGESPISPVGELYSCDTAESNASPNYVDITVIAEVGAQRALGGVLDSNTITFTLVEKDQ